MWMTRNEVRGLENLNPVEDGDDFENPATTAPEAPTEEVALQPAQEGQAGEPE